MSRIAWSAICVVCVLGLIVLPACQTDQSGVRSSYRSQYTDVAASTEKATQAAEDVLEDLELKNVESRATAVDGRAVGYTADGTQVTVSITRNRDDSSQVSVNVGTLGDPALGKRIIADIQKRLAD